MQNIKVVILAGGFGTRITEETGTKPKPMVEIDGKPILWHIMKIYSSFGFNDFIICLGYKGYVIKEYFMNYHLHQSDLTIDMKNDEVCIHSNKTEPWKVTLVDTGLGSMTGGRVKRIQRYVGDNTFMLTYGDGLGNVNIKKLIEFHKEKKMYATVSAVQPLGRFGALIVNDENNVTDFKEKPKGDGDWINGGFFVLEPEVFNYISGDQSVFEKDVLNKLLEDGQLAAFKHLGFWQPMDTLRDKINLEKLAKQDKAPWKIWTNSEEKGIL